MIKYNKRAARGFLKYRLTPFKKKQLIKNAKNEGRERSKKTKKK